MAYLFYFLCFGLFFDANAVALDEKCQLCLRDEKATADSCRDCAIELNRVMLGSLPENLNGLMSGIKVASHAECGEENLASKACKIYQAVCDDGCDRVLLDKISDHEQKLNASSSII